MRKIRIYAVIYVILYFICILFFLISWIRGIDTTQGKTLRDTFSSLLAVSDETKLYYIIWLWFFVLHNVFSLYIMFIEYIHCILLLEHNVREALSNIGSHIHTKNRNILNISNIDKTSLGGLSILLVLLTFIKLLALLFVFIYPVTDIHLYPSHVASAGIAFGSAVGGAFVSFIRRWHILNNIYKLRCFQDSFYSLIFGLNFICILTQITFIILFAVFKTGEYEFTLSMAILIEPLFNLVNLFMIKK